MQMNSTTDIRDQFFDHCSYLGQGELIHHNEFSLQDAMSAIEIMDCKMDCGMAKDRIVNSWKLCIELETLPLKYLNPNQLLDVVDETLSAMVNWLEGEMLAQTVYTNMYMHCISKIEYKPLRSFCEGINKTVNIIYQLMSTLRLYREEDFNLFDQGLPLSRNEIDTEQTLDLLKKSDDDLSKIQRQCENNEEAEILSNIIKRFRFLHSFLSFLYALKRYTDNDSDLSLSTMKQLIHKHLDFSAKLIVNIIESQPPAITTKCQTNNADETIIKTSSSTNNCDNVNNKPPTVIGFEPYLNNSLLPPAVTKTCIIFDRKNSFIYYKDLIQRLRFVIKVLSIGDSRQHILQQMQFVMVYGHLGLDGKSCLLSRNLLCLLLFNPYSNSVLSSTLNKKDLYRTILHIYFGDHPIWDHIDTMLTINNKDKTGGSASSASAVAAAAGSMDINIKHLHYLNERMTGFLLQIYYIYGHNRSRQQNMIAAFINNIWTIYEEAVMADNIIQNSFKMDEIPTIQFWSAYLLQQLYRLMWDYVQCGFDLSLYATHELPGLYYCVCEMLFTPYENQLKEFRTYLRQMQQQHPTLLVNSNNKKLTGKRKSENIKKNLLPCLDDIDSCLLRVCIYYMLSRATMYALAAFHLDDKFPIMKLPFGSNELRFLNRFSPLLNTGIHDPQEVYTRFKSFWIQITNENVENNAAPPTTAAQVDAGLTNNLEEAIKMYDLVKKQLMQIASKEGAAAKSTSGQNSSLPDILQYSNCFPEDERNHLIHLTKVNFVVCNLLKNGHKRGTSAKLQLEWPIHGSSSTRLSFFPIFRLIT